MANNSVAVHNSITSGHGGFPPTTTIATQLFLFINGQPVVVEGDLIITHCNNSLCHTGTVQPLTNLIYVNGKKIARIGDPISCGDTIAQGSTLVFGD